jgi:hypothetical protein
MPFFLLPDEFSVMGKSGGKNSARCTVIEALQALQLKNFGTAKYI